MAYNEDPTGSRRRTNLPGYQNELTGGFTMPGPRDVSNDGGNGGGNGGLYDDPYTALFESAAKRRITDLSKPFSDPALDDVMSLIRNQVGSLSSAAPVSFNASNPLLTDFITQGRQRISELNQEPFSETEEARYRTRATENVEKQRASAKRRALEDISRRGIADTSGILLDMEQDIDRSADANKTTAETDLAMFLTGERNRRRDTATTIAGQLAGAGQAEAAMTQQGQIAAAGLNQSRQGQIMQAAGMLADLAAQRRGEARANQNDILQIAQTLSQLGPQRLALMMSVLNNSPSPDSVFQNTLNLSNTQAAQRNQNQQGRAALNQGLAAVLSYFSNRYGSGGGAQMPGTNVGVPQIP